MRPRLQFAPEPTQPASELPPASDFMPTLRIAAMANLPTLDGDEGEGTIHPQMTAASMADGIYSVHHDPMQDVVMPPSPRLPLLLRPRTTRAGHWNGSVLAEWVRLNTPSDED